MSEIDFYTRYYAAAGKSRANAAYCERLFGKNLAQHGFAEMLHLEALIAVTGIHAHSRVLDLGCGSGGIAEYISDQTGAHVTGIDFVPEAIYENHRDEAQGAMRAFEAGMHARYLYRIDLPEDE